MSSQGEGVGGLSSIDVPQGFTTNLLSHLQKFLCATFIIPYLDIRMTFDSRQELLLYLDPSILLVGSLPVILQVARQAHGLAKTVVQACRHIGSNQWRDEGLIDALDFITPCARNDFG